MSSRRSMLATWTACGPNRRLWSVVSSVLEDQQAIASGSLENHQLSHAVLKFPNVPRPPVDHHGILRSILIAGIGGHFDPDATLPYQEFPEWNDVFGPVAQGCDMKIDHVQSIIKISL